MKRCSGLLAALCLLTIAGTLANADSATVHDWLQRMADAMQTADYQGTFVYVHDGELESMRITHVHDDSGSRERLVSVTGALREIVRENDELRCVFPDNQTMLVDASAGAPLVPLIPSEELRRQNGQYRFTLGSRARVAGRDAQQLVIMPVDEFRYGYELWVDVEYGVLLKSILREAENRVVAKLMFTDIRFGSAVDIAELRPQSSPERFVSVPMGVPAGEPASIGEPPRWHASRPPPGFKLAGHRHVKDSVDGRAPRRVYEHLVYSDGLASVSIYVETLPAGQSSVSGFTRVGAMNAYSRQRDNLLITAIGEVPNATLQRFADQLVQE